MPLAFKKWAAIDGLVLVNGDFAVVDRLALRETSNPRNLHRWQVFNSNQESWKMFKSKDDAIADCMARGKKVDTWHYSLKLVG